MINYSYNSPQDSLIKIDIKTSIDTNIQKQNNNFENYKKYIYQSSTDTNYSKNKKNISSKSVKVTNWSIKIK